MAFSPPVREAALVASGRHCCLCHKFCGIKIELHHIVQQGEDGEDSFDNCMPLCFDCHADMRSYDHLHPKGTKYTPNELKRHRDNWYSKVSASPGSTYTDRSVELDRNTFVLILKLVSYSKLVRFIEEQAFAGAFSPKVFEDLDQVVRESRDPALEFIDADLEGMRLKLVDGIAKFGDYLATHTWPTPSGLQSIPAEWEDQQQQRFTETLEILHALASEVSSDYRTFFREGRKRFGVQPSAG